MASTTDRDGINWLSCSENLEVEASVTRYSKTLPHVRRIIPEHSRGKEKIIIECAAHTIPFAKPERFNREVLRVFAP